MSKIIINLFVAGSLAALSGCAVGASNEPAPRSELRLEVVSGGKSVSLGSYVGPRENAAAFRDRMVALVHGDSNASHVAGATAHVTIDGVDAGETEIAVPTSKAGEKTSVELSKALEADAKSFGFALVVGKGSVSGGDDGETASTAQEMRKQCESSYCAWLRREMSGQGSPYPLCAHVTDSPGDCRNPPPCRVQICIGICWCAVD